MCVCIQIISICSSYSHECQRMCTLNLVTKDTFITYVSKHGLVLKTFYMQSHHAHALQSNGMIYLLGCDSLGTQLYPLLGFLRWLPKSTMWEFFSRADYGPACILHTSTPALLSQLTLFLSHSLSDNQFPCQ